MIACVRNGCRKRGVTARDAFAKGTVMHLKHLLFAGVAAAGFAMPMSAGTALAADSTYQCNDERCYDDQAAETRNLNQQSLDQAQRENDDDDYNGMGGRSYDSGDDTYRDRDNYGERDNMYGDDDEDNDDAVDTNPSNDRDDDD
jgi:hypothetical protein